MYTVSISRRTERDTVGQAKTVQNDADTVDIHVLGSPSFFLTGDLTANS